MQYFVTAVNASKHSYNYAELSCDNAGSRRKQSHATKQPPIDQKKHTAYN